MPFVDGEDGNRIHGEWDDLCKFVDTDEELDTFYGCTDIELTEEDLELLREGKILNIGISCNEYAVAIKYKGGTNHDKS